MARSAAYRSFPGCDLHLQLVEQLQRGEVIIRWCLLDGAFAFDHKDTGFPIGMCDMFISFMSDEYVGTL